MDPADLDLRAERGSVIQCTKRVKLVDIEYFNAGCVNPPEGIKSLDWIKGGFKGADC